MKQESKAAWYGDSGGCSNGLGHPAVPDGSGEKSEGVTWFFKESPGQSFTVKCTPYALMDVEPESTTSGFCVVGYKAIAVPLRLTLGGEVWTSGSVRKVAIGDGLRRASRWVLVLRL